MKKLYATLNLLSTILVIYWNYYTAVKGFNGVDVGEMSNRYDTLFTPAGYAFSIWGFIFLAMTGLSIFHIRRAFFSNKKSEFIEQTGPWFFLANLFNGLWVYFWLTGTTWLTPIIMTLLLFSLIKIILRTNMERWDAPIEVIVFQWWPICIYSGWITVALIANISAFLVKIEWSGWGISPQNWTVIMIIIAGVINLWMISLRNMREFAAVAIWAFVAIAVKQWDNAPFIAYMALGTSAIILLNILIHGYKNRATAPPVKFLQRLKG